MQGESPAGQVARQPAALEGRAIPAARASQANLQLAILWLLLRVLTTLFAAAVSPIRPLTAREAAIAVWPPSAPWTAWAERVLLAPWERRDAVYYLQIVAAGYRAGDGTASFHPLLSWLALPLGRLTGQPLLALVLVSSCAGLALLLAFRRLAELDLEPGTARTATLLLLLSPLAFSLFAPYPEALFLLCAVLCLWWARQQKWWLAGAAGALATLTRQQGIFLVFPLAWEVWEAAGRDWRKLIAAWRQALSIGLPIGGYLLWIAYRGAVLGDLHADLHSLQALAYSILVSPDATKVVPVQAFYWPWQALWLAVRTFLATHHYAVGIDLALGLGFLILLALAWRGMRPAYRIYCVAITLVSFAYYTGPFYPYMGLPRHLLLAFPVFIGLAPRLRERWKQRIIFGAGTIGSFFLLMQYVIEGWVP